MELVPENTIKVKYCYYCKITKEEIYFSKNKSKKDGLADECKDCIKILGKIRRDKSKKDINYQIKQKEYNREYNKKHYLKNKDIINEKNKEYRSNNKEKIKKAEKGYRSKNKEKRKEYELKNKDKKKEYNKEYGVKNKEKIKKKSKEYHSKNKEHYKEKNKEYRSKNKEKLNKNKTEYIKNRILNDPAYKLRRNCSRSINRYLKLNNSSKNGKSILDHLPSSIEDMKNHIESQFEHWMTWENHGVYNIKNWDDNDPTTWTWQLDHIIPQSKLPYTSMEDQNFKKCWSLENIRPYSAKQNCIDGNRR